MTKRVAGIDVGKQAVAVSVARGPVRRFPNTAAGLTAATLLAYVPELGQGSGKALTALVGVVPWAADSGTHRGYRAIRVGRGRVRRALYMAALSVIRTNTDLGWFYQRLRRWGKPGKVAVVAVMRKLLLRLHALAWRGTPWVPEGALAS